MNEISPYHVGLRRRYVQQVIGMVPLLVLASLLSIIFPLSLEDMVLGVVLGTAIWPVIWWLLLDVPLERKYVKQFE